MTFLRRALDLALASIRWTTGVVLVIFAFSSMMVCIIDRSSLARLGAE